MTENVPRRIPLSVEAVRARLTDSPPLMSYLSTPSIDPSPFRYDDPEVLARGEADRRENRRRLRVLTDRHAAVVARCSGTLRKVAEAHSPFSVEAGIFHPTCQGCVYDNDGWDGGPGGWPCPTFEMIEEDTA